MPPPVPRFPDGTLLEGIVTTLNADGSPHIAPMGPIVDANFERLLLRPFRTSMTYRNLKRTGEGVLHVTDDVELFARAAVGRLEPLPALQPAEAVDGVILSDACRWYAFRVESLDDREDRTTIVANVVDRGRLRDFFGFNRAKHAVIEAAILATRIGIVDADTIAAEFDSSGVARRKNRRRARTAGFRIPAAVRARGIATDRRNGDAAAMTHAVHVRAPCRLHFGMFSFGHADRPQFGGVGVMIDPPAVELTFIPAARFNVTRYARRAYHSFCRNGCGKLAVTESAGVRDSCSLTARSHWSGRRHAVGFVGGRRAAAIFESSGIAGRSAGGQRWPRNAFRRRHTRLSARRVDCRLRSSERAARGQTGASALPFRTSGDSCLSFRWTNAGWPALAKPTRLLVCHRFRTT